MPKLDQDARNRLCDDYGAQCPAVRAERREKEVRVEQTAAKEELNSVCGSNAFLALTRLTHGAPARATTSRVGAALAVLA